MIEYTHIKEFDYSSVFLKKETTNVGLFRKPALETSFVVTVDGEIVFERDAFEDAEIAADNVLTIANFMFSSGNPISTSNEIEAEMIDLGFEINEVVIYE